MEGLVTMKKAIAFSLAALMLFAGCSRLFTREAPSQAPPKSEASPAPAPPAPAPSKPESEPDKTTPQGAAEGLLQEIVAIDEDSVKELAAKYLSSQPVPDAYIDLLTPITSRVTYDVGKATIDGGKARVAIAVTSVDAESAIKGVLPGALAHYAALQLTGRDVSEPEKILAKYAAENIDWDKLPTVKTDTALHLVKGENGEWQVDSQNPENMAFIDAVTGGAITVASELQGLAQNFQ
jgi:hypothetical protein